MSRIGGEHGNSFWPGYVDALVNVVLNLMFLSAILAAGSFFQGLESSRRRATTVPADGTAARLKPGRNALTSSAESGSPNREHRAYKDAMQLTLHFADNVVRVDDKARERLKQELQLQISRGIQYWNVSIEADVDDNMQRRAAYLRMISVRSVLMEAGIDPSHFSLRIQPAKVANVGQQTLHIVPDRQVPKRNLQPPLRTKAPDHASPQPEEQRRSG